MPTQPEDIFPHPELTPIQGEPTYTSIHSLHVELNANAASVESPPITGTLGFLALTVSPEVFISVNGSAWTPPVHPGTFTLAANASNAKATQMKGAHKQQKVHHHLYLKTDASLKTLLLAEVDPVYLLKLKH